MEQRRTQRYRLQLPLQIVQLGNQRINRITNCVNETRDISSGGVCFLSPTDVEVGGRIEYLITLSGTDENRSNPPVRIRCLGKVMRSRLPVAAATETQFPEPQFEVAVTMERYQFVRAEGPNTEPEAEPEPV